MGFRPYKNSGTQGQINRVAIISDFERIDPDPDNLTLLKRKVDEFDVLETDDPGAWETAVAAITSDNFRKMFEGGNMDRLRYRYQVYGWDRATIESALDDLSTALP